MRIAFVGKGGSGKTTVSSLFSLYADEQNKRVGLLNVDVNSHAASVLGLAQQPELDLSQPAVSREIYEYLVGKTPRVNPMEFLNSTPPGVGSGVFTLDVDNMITQQFGWPFGKLATIAWMRVKLIAVWCV